MDYIKRVQLSEIVEIVTKGTTPTTLGYEFQDEGVNFLKIECFNENGGFIESKVAHISEECHKKMKRSQLKNGDILFSIAGAIGRVAIVTEEMLPANINQALAIIRISDEQVYLPYIKLILTSPIVIEQFERKKQGVAQLNLSLKDINEISIPLPSKDKQIELVELFDKVVGVISKRNKELSALDDLTKARFVEMFGDVKYGTERWGGKLFKDITINLDSKRKPVKDADRKKMQGIYPYYGATGIVDYVNDYRQDGEFLLISEDGKALELRSKPIAFLASGKIWVNNHAHVQQCTDECNMVYLMYHINFMDISIWVTGIDQKKLNRANLDTIPIALPPIELQEQFADFVNQVYKSKVKVQKALDETQKLFDSLMQQYFG